MPLSLGDRRGNERKEEREHHPYKEVHDFGSRYAPHLMVRRTNSQLTRPRRHLGPLRRQVLYGASALLAIDSRRTLERISLSHTTTTMCQPSDPVSLCSV